MFDRDVNISINNLSNIQNDFIKVGFPISFTINFYFVALIISLFSTTLTYISIPKTIKIDNPIIFIKELFKILINYVAVLFGLLYIFRFFNFSRGLIIFGIFVYILSSYSLIWLLRLEKYKKIGTKNLIPTIVLVLLMSSVFFKIQNSTQSVSIEATTTTTTTTTLFYSEIDNSECFPWLGSDNFSECKSGVELVSSTKYSESLNNIIVFKDNIFVLDVFGVIYKNSPSNVYLDISTKVSNRTNKELDIADEQGLFGLAFHPTENFILVSYSDLENSLVIEKFMIDEYQNPTTQNPEIMIKIPNSIGSHFSGNLIYSNFFKDFIFSVGDMESNPSAYSNSEPIDTTSLRGKIILLNTEISNPELLSLDKNSEPMKNIIAYGLRNPWKTYEYKNLLFVPDIGAGTEEELNILNLEEISTTLKPYLLGWPHYEGTINNEILYNDIFLYQKGVANNINSFVKENSIFPKVFYRHQAPKNYRSAIIGGGVIDNIESKYYEHYFFADFISNELFAYNFNKNEISTFPLGNVNSYITSVAIHPKKLDTVLLATGSGNLIEVKLP